MSKLIKEETGQQIYEQQQEHAEKSRLAEIARNALKFGAAIAIGIHMIASPVQAQEIKAEEPVAIQQIDRQKANETYQLLKDIRELGDRNQEYRANMLAYHHVKADVKIMKKQVEEQLEKEGLTDANSPKASRLLKALKKDLDTANRELKRLQTDMHEAFSQWKTQSELVKHKMGTDVYEKANPNELQKDALAAAQNLDNFNDGLSMREKARMHFESLDPAIQIAYHEATSMAPNNDMQEVSQLAMK